MKLRNLLAALATLCAVSVASAAHAACPYTGNTSGTDSAAEVSALNDICANSANSAQQAKSGQATYHYAATGIAPPATTTDFFFCTGSDTKVVRIIGFQVTRKSTAAAQVAGVLIVKRSALDTGGTATAMTAVPTDSTAPAATGACKYYTVLPSPLGAAIGNLRAYDGTTSVLAGAGGAFGLIQATMNQPPTTITFDAPIALHGSVEGVYFNYSGNAVPSGETDSLEAITTESAN